MFLLPGAQYAGSALEWLLLAGLSAWTGALGFWTFVDDESVKRSIAIYVVDIAVSFAAYSLVTHVTVGGSGQGAESNVILAGAFQLQTYGTAILAGALTGVPGGLTSGAASAIVYAGCLWHINGDSIGFLDKGPIHEILARAAAYLVCGFMFGLYNSLVGRLRHELRVAAETEARAEAIRQFHRSGLNLLDVIASAIAGVRDNAEEPMRTRISRIHQCLRVTTNSLRGAFALHAPTPAISAASAIAQTCALLELALDPSTGQAIAVNVVDGDFSLTPEEATALDNIISEAVSNAVKHAAVGTIQVLGRPLDDGYAVRVIDPGPRPIEAPNSEPVESLRYGLQDIRDLAANQGWTPTLDISRVPGHPSMIAVVLPPPRLGARTTATPSEPVTEIGQ